MNNDSQPYIEDEFLAGDSDCPVFGLNLACAYPFPATIEDSYNTLASRLMKLDDGVYVYPLWETHVTIMTFLNFSLHQRPSAELRQELQALVGPLKDALHNLFDSKTVEPFRLEFGPPQLSRKAAILPISNRTGEIARIRRRATELLEKNKELHAKVVRGGLNVPGIVHSTIMRFKKAPHDLPAFAAGFDAVVKSTAPFAITVQEILLTTETKPYMREGEIVHHFSLATR